MLASIMEAVKAVAQLIGKLIPGKKPKAKIIIVPERKRNAGNKR